MKICKICKLYKSADNFYKSRGKSLHPNCKKCSNEKSRLRLQIHNRFAGKLKKTDTKLYDKLYSLIK